MTPKFCDIDIIHPVITYLVSGGIFDGQGVRGQCSGQGWGALLRCRGEGLYLLLLIIGDIFPH